MKTRINNVKVMNLRDPNLKHARLKVGAQLAQENAQKALEASAKLRAYVESVESPLFPQTGKSK